MARPALHCCSKNVTKKKKDMRRNDKLIGHHDATSSARPRDFADAPDGFSNNQQTACDGGEAAPRQDKSSRDRLTLV